jgi:hypothetical protein
VLQGLGSSTGGSSSRGLMPDGAIVGEEALAQAGGMAEEDMAEEDTMGQGPDSQPSGAAAARHSGNAADDPLAGVGSQGAQRSAAASDAAAACCEQAEEGGSVGGTGRGSAGQLTQAESLEGRDQGQLPVVAGEGGSEQGAPDPEAAFAAAWAAAAAAYQGHTSGA